MSEIERLAIATAEILDKRLADVPPSDDDDRIATMAHYIRQALQTTDFRAEARTHRDVMERLSKLVKG